MFYIYDYREDRWADEGLGFPTERDVQAFIEREERKYALRHKQEHNAARFGVFKLHSGVTPEECYWK